MSVLQSVVLDFTNQLYQQECVFATFAIISEGLVYHRRDVFIPLGCHSTLVSMAALRDTDDAASAGDAGGFHFSSALASI